MKRAVRNRLADLLLQAFDDPEKRTAIAWLALFCEVTILTDRPQIPLTDLLAHRRAAFPGVDGSVETALDHLIGPGKLLQLRRADTGEFHASGVPGKLADIPWLVELEPDACAAYPALCERARMYARIAARIGRSGATSRPRDSLQKAMAEAALCFNAGLFFEAHEHLEHCWASQPRGPMKRFLQGIIQISVGFHHAHAGNYEGAINQLAKGLEKTAGVTGELLGLNCDAFLPKIAGAREAIVKRGRARMRPIPLAEIPHMPVRE